MDRLQTCSTYMNFRFLSSNNAVTIESSTFCTHAPCNNPLPKKIKKNPTTRTKNQRKQDGRDLNGVVRPNIVLIYGFQPSNIIMGVSDDMDIELPGNDPLRGVVRDVLRFNGEEHHSEENKLEKVAQGGDRHGFPRWSSVTPSLTASFAEQKEIYRRRPSRRPRSSSRWIKSIINNY